MACGSDRIACGSDRMACGPAGWRGGSTGLPTGSTGSTGSQASRATAAEGAAGAGQPAPAMLILSRPRRGCVDFVGHQAIPVLRERNLVRFPYLARLPDGAALGKVGLLFRFGPRGLTVHLVHAHPYGPYQRADDDQASGKGGKHVEYVARRGRHNKRRGTHAPIIAQRARLGSPECCRRSEWVPTADGRSFAGYVPLCSRPWNRATSPADHGCRNPWCPGGEHRTMGP
jgi:hypothetical protein